MPWTRAAGGRSPACPRGQVKVNAEARELAASMIGALAIRLPLRPARWRSYETRSKPEHCVILHHGPDVAAGRRFASHEALALYRLNALDAQLKGSFEHGFAGP